MRFINNTFVKLIFIMVLWQFSIVANADVAVEGVVKDQNGKSLEGVIIQIKGTDLAVITNSRGEYKMDVADNATLVYSFIGLKTVEKKINNKVSNLDITLEDDSQQLAQNIVFGSFF